MQTVDPHFFPLAKGQRVLDLGCGEGRHVIAMQALCGADAVGVDLSLQDLATAQARQKEFVAEHPSEALFALLAGNALEQPQVLVHRDYHSRNLMLTERNNPGILDFQDAVIGPVTYDLVSLLRDCYISWPHERVEDWALGGGVFRNLARLSAAGLPTIAVLHGPSTAGGAYMPGLSDYVIGVRKNGMAALAGAALVHAAFARRMCSDDGSLEYGSDERGPFAAYRLEAGEALYSAVVVRFTGQLHARDAGRR